jgi:hypothetical protein
MKRTILVTFFIIFFLTILAQWSNDPAVNTTVSGLSGDQTIPKIGTAPNGDVYVGWFSNTTENYNVRLQRYDTNGYAQWQENGILISDHSQESWLTDWDMKVDNQGNAILSFNDIRNGGWDIIAYKISPAGEFMWGEDGIELSSNANFNVIPNIAITSQNNVVIGWQCSNDGNSYIRKLSAEGEFVWEDMIVLTGTNTYTFPQIWPVADDSVIVKYFEDSGPPYSPTRHVYARKLDVDGAMVWETIISDAGGISAWNQFFEIKKDSNHGFFISWYDDRDNDMDANLYIQHLDADGNISYLEDGLEVVDEPDNEHYYPKLSYLKETEEVVVFWEKMDIDQNERGLFAQKIDMEGNILWPAAGVELFPLGGTDPYPFAAGTTDENAVVFFTQTQVNEQVRAICLNSSGEYVWPEEVVTLSTRPNNKIHLVATSFSNDQWITAWNEDAGNNLILAQNITAAGELGTDVETGIIEGTVTLLDGAGNVEDVQITTNGIIVYPNANGNYSMEIAVGTYSVTAYLEGYAEQTVEAVEVIADQTTSGIDFNLEVVANDQDLPLVTKLVSAYPNPFNPQTTIKFELAQPQNVQLEIWNARGRKIRTLVNQNLKAGTHQLVWNGDDSHGAGVASGIYYCRLQTEQNTFTKKMMLLK